MLHFKRNISRASAYAGSGSMTESAKKFEGHHPSCGNFSAHVFHLGDKKCCAGCTGLVIGAIISFFGTLIFSFTKLFLDDMGIVFFWLGFVWIVLGLLQYNLLDVQRSFIHLFLNVIFVLGAFLFLVGMEEISSNPILEGYLLTLTLFWILTRILLSEQEHRKICIACGLKSCRFLE